MRNKKIIVPACLVCMFLSLISAPPREGDDEIIEKSFAHVTNTSTDLRAGISDTFDYSTLSSNDITMVTKPHIVQNQRRQIKEQTPEQITKTQKENKDKKKTQKKKKKKTEESYSLSNSEINLVALITAAEAEGECEKGQRLVIDTILNRVDYTHFPNNVHDVIYQRNQFSSVWNGRTDRVSVTDYFTDLVKSELKSRSNYDVMFFTAGHYGQYGTPLFKVGNHYFTSY